ncbi:eukaryotic aspartyl protease [Phlyctema vagabunda]|uniref:Eukaryotic aspartyl protease n=1 Tax=Phlyctema vagabunda TaxID=108571 RepID=A0ABR4PX03_9HELO
MALQPRIATRPAPITFAPSQAFEGNDGPWSTFVIRIGTPEQVFHVHISTASQETWIPVPEGCLSTDPSDCGALRGAMPFQNQPSNGFQVDASSSWVPINLFALGLDSNLNYTGNGQYGFETIGLQLPQSGGVALHHQIVAGIATKDFYLGVFGLGPKPTNFTNFDEPQPSFMWSLKNQSMIPSLSWSYTAGAPYRLKKVLGSLTLGGYDASRFTPNDMNFTFSADDSRVLTVGLQAIQATNTFQGVMSLLPSGILTLIDSTIPEIWLPTSACAIFETAFGLNYDPHTDRYLVNDTIRENLMTMNPIITFKLGNTIEGGDSIDINIPYAAFDLQADYPIYPNNTNYFPLRRATDESQYTLGRTFLQEAYVIADYERSNFSVSQCVFRENNEERIIAIRSVSEETKSTGLSRNILIAIIVASVVLVMIIATCTFVAIRVRRARRLRVSSMTVDTSFGADKHDSGVSELVGQEMRHELASVKSPVAQKHASDLSELVGEDTRHELSTLESPVELQGSPVIKG